MEHAESSGNNLIRTDTLDQGAAGTLITTWQQKGGRVTTPSNGAKVSIELWIQLSSGWAAFDDVSLRPVVTYNLAYDAENRLSSVSGAATASFVYDGDGRRVKATVGGVTTVYISDYLEWTGSTSTMVKYYYAGGARIAMRVGTGSGTTGLSWLLSDHLGSTAVTADGSGNKVSELRYKGWGETRYSSGTTPTKRQYTGQIYETSLGLHFYNARWWDSSLGRFAQADSIVPGAGNPIAWDRYAGMGNNPLRFTDPSGYDPVCGQANSDPECNGENENTTLSLYEMAALYGINFIGSWSIDNMAFVLLGVDAVGSALGNISQRSASNAFKGTYGVDDVHNFNFSWGNCQECDGAGAYTYSARDIRFASFWQRGPNRSFRLAAEMSIHNVVHELGHAFDSRTWVRRITSGAKFNLGRTALWWAQQNDANFPDRPYGNDQSYGFAGPFGNWQQNPSGAPGEEFADMFLGWTYNKWGSGIGGQIRADFMNKTMPFLVDLAKSR